MPTPDDLAAERLDKSTTVEEWLLCPPGCIRDMALLAHAYPALRSRVSALEAERDRLADELDASFNRRCELNDELAALKEAARPTQEHRS